MGLGMPPYFEPGELTRGDGRGGIGGGVLIFKLVGVEGADSRFR